jgi:hypothetical protein
MISGGTFQRGRDAAAFCFATCENTRKIIPCIFRDWRQTAARGGARLHMASIGQRESYQLGRGDA